MNDAANRAGAQALAALHEAERQHAEKQARRRKPRGKARPCVYCGQRCWSKGEPAACRIHMDLRELDPHYSA